MRSLSAPIMVKQPTHSPSIRGSVYASPPRLHDAPLMDSTLGPTLASPFSSLQAPQKGSLHISPDCFCSSSLKPSYQPDLSCWPHPSDNRFLRKEKRGPPAPSQGDPRSQLPVSGASPKPPDNLYRLAIRATKSWDKCKSDQCVSVICFLCS